MKNLYFTLVALVLSFTSFGQAGVITGTPYVCMGSTTTLSDTPAGGTWTSGNPAVAAIGSSSGIVTGNTPGTASITYTAPGGSTATMNVTVNSLNIAPTSNSPLCAGDTLYLFANESGTASGINYTWSGSLGYTNTNMNVVVYGEPIDYMTGVWTLYASAPGTGCTDTATLTVVAGTASIAGWAYVCQGLTVSLSDPTPSGTWSSSNPSLASVDPVTGIVTGVAPGTGTITYTAPGGCANTTPFTISAGAGTIAGTLAICDGYTTTLTDATPGGTWSLGGAIAVIGSASGIATGLASGTAIVTYALSTGCITTAILTVNPMPVGLTITPNPLCVGATATLSDPIGMGSWSSSDPAVASPTISGIIGNSAGTTNITYALPTGCSWTIQATVNPAPAPITGTLFLCVYGGTSALSDAVPGGTWTTSSPAVASVVPSTGFVTAVTAGTTTISYSIPSGCSATAIVTVDPGPGAISGPSNICEISSVTFSDASPGGTWTCSPVVILTIGSTTGVATGVSAGTATVYYTLGGGCSSSMIVTVDATPVAPVISGTSLYCPCVTFVPFTVVPSLGILWYTAPTGGTGSSTAPVINTCIPAVTTSWASQTAGGCESPRASFTVTVDATPVITAGSTSNCGGTFSLTGGGAGTGGTYSWLPTTGLSCPGCATTSASISASTIYTVTGTDVSGCSGTANVTVDADRISGYISLAATPTDTAKVWLIQFNPSDSSLIAEDSTLSCMNSGTLYYEFDGKPAGSYMVKAKLLSSVPGTSGYVPTYGLSSNLWSSADMFTHTGSATDTMHINMIYGTVPAGPGFIGGLISSGAGRGTSGAVPAVGMLVYLKDGTTGTILTYTYTDATGAYSFSGLANGSYTIYPVDYHYYTIPWAGVTLSVSAETAAGVSFYQHTMYGTITPYTTPVPVCCGPSDPTINIFPNPADNDVNLVWQSQPLGSADLLVTDVTGREVYRSVIDINSHNGNRNLNVSGFDNGVYIISIRSKNVNYTNKLLIQR